jgi:LysR family nitrogen assimilation transcriptional regulator
MDLKKLVYFATIAECGSFTKAAALLHIAQPALSRQIALLEDEFGVPLLLRMGRHVRLTDAGEVLLRHAHEIARSVERARDEMQSRTLSPKGTVRIGTPPSLSAIVAPKLIETIRRDFPDVVLKFREGTSLFLERSIMDAELDLALVAETPMGRGVDGVRLATEDIALIARRGIVRRLLRGRSVSSLGVPLFTTWQVSAMLKPLASALRFDLSPAIEIDAFLTVKDLVIAGAGMALVPVGVYAAAIRRGRVVAAQISDTPIQRPVFLARASARSGGRAVDAVASALQAEMLLRVREGAFQVPSWECADVVRSASDGMTRKASGSGESDVGAGAMASSATMGCIS